MQLSFFLFCASQNMAWSGLALCLLAFLALLPSPLVQAQYEQDYQHVVWNGHDYFY